MVLSGNDIDLSFAQIATALNAKPFGTPSYAVQRLHVLGLQVDYRPRTLADAMTDIQQHRPLICFVRTQFLDHWTKDVAHAVVLVDIEPEQRFWTHDPWLADGPRLSPGTASWQPGQSSIFAVLHLRRLCSPKEGKELL
jgi:hypothetical protein